MSKQIFKVHIEYDTNWGFSETKDFYILQNNSIDYRHIVNKNGEDLPTHGTDSYCNCLSHALLLENYDNVGDKCVVEEISLNDLPNKIKEIYMQY